MLTVDKNQDGVPMLISNSDTIVPHYAILTKHGHASVTNLKISLLVAAKIKCTHERNNKTIKTVTMYFSH